MPVGDMGRRYTSCRLPTPASSLVLVGMAGSAPSSTGAIKDLEAWQQDPGNIKLAEAFAALYGHIIPTKWLYGYSDIYDFSVEFKSGSTATASTVSHGLDAAIQASGWGAKGNANTKMNMEANYSAATQGSESSLSTSRIIQGPPECAEADVANCLELFLSDVR
eukprot:CAMPEP_0203780524 /NCGR_PEP_ID=MMETSP0099_2-20121227/9516_1 /ASSEMBLY_ACC=CAM_ASM_000209 /TAXON_ID=96639 /ORGANISM=" , Strain NY0313808BC1" /LENGTH=163 /DNA_ID=CAMNT_0050680985 /DNA_START=36 /DNA_END=524 /DNA_ORIENTATION=+